MTKTKLTKNLGEIRKLIEEFTPELSFYEKEQLFPSIVGRLEYLRDIFWEFQGICRDRNVALHIDASLRELLDPRIFDLGVPEPEVGVSYLNSIFAQIDAEFLIPLNNLLSPERKRVALERTENLVNYFNEVNIALQSIVATKEKIFKYSFRAFSNIRNTRTGKVNVGPQDHYVIALTPFEARLEEMVNVSQSSIDSIKFWAEKLRNEKSKYIDLIVNMSQVKAAEEQSIAARWNLYAQVAVIIFTVVLIAGAQKATVYLEKSEVENALNLMSQKYREVLTENDSLKESLDKAQSDLKKIANEFARKQEVLKK